MNAELLDNRSRLVRKIGLLHSAYRQLEADPASAPRLVADKRNQQVTLSQAAWVMTVETGALRLLPPAERSRYASVYSAQGTYYDILVQEMTHWAALGGLSDSDRSALAVQERDKAIRLWKTYANRVALGVCISLARTQLTFEPKLPRDKLWESCQAYRLDQPPAKLLTGLGAPSQPAGTFL